MRHSGDCRRLSSRSPGRSGKRAVLERIHGGTVAGAGVNVSRTGWTGRGHLLCILRILLPPDRLPHLQVDLPPSNSGRADGNRRFRLADLSGPAARTLSVSLHYGPRPSLAPLALPVPTT